MSNLRIGIILGSTRPGRRGDQVANWVLDNAQSLRPDVDFDLIDLADFNLPHLDEPASASSGIYEREHTKAWSATIDAYDGFVFVTPEYNHAPSGALKNAIDFLYQEWNNKVAAIVSYGASASGMRAAEHLRLILSELQLAHVRQQLAFSLVHDFENFQTMNPGPQHAKQLAVMVDQLADWGTALRSVREQKLAIAA